VLRIATMLTLCSMPVLAQSADPWLGPDKALHFGVSLGLASGGYAASALVLEPRWARACAGGGLALLAGGAKELYDLNGGGNASWKDFTWDVLGAATGVGLAYVVDRWLWPRPAVPREAMQRVPSGPFDFAAGPSVQVWAP